MQLRGFLKAGHPPTLFCAFLYFDVSFMVWVLLGALANAIVPDFELSEAERGLTVAVPLLGGATLRIGVGLLADRIGARHTALIGMVLTLVPLLLGWLWADSFSKLILVGLLLGVAGSSFAAALPLASRWYPPEYQGLALGIAGAGNSGTALTTFFAPRLAIWLGWHTVFALALVPILITLVLFYFLAKDSPHQLPAKPVREYLTVLKMPDTWWFCFFYSVTFGGFVGLASFLNSYFRIEYDLDPVSAGNLATLCVIAGSFLRPVGGYTADRFGGVSMLTALFLGVTLAMLGLASGLALPLAVLLMFVGMGLLGMGNGSVFQLVPQRFAQQIGVITGIVGAAGGIGGFFLPTVLGALKHETGSFAGGFALFALTSAACCGALIRVSRSWEADDLSLPAPALQLEESVA